jgi:hypothetical protein
MRRIILVILSLTLSFNICFANKTYTKENITKHLETIFQKHIEIEKKYKGIRFNRFKQKVAVYYEFSNSIKDKNKKLKIIKKVAKKFEKLTNLEFYFKNGRPDITVSMVKNNKKITYNSLESFFEEHIAFSFSNRDEFFEKITNKDGYWYSVYMINMDKKIKQKAVSIFKKYRDITFPGRNINGDFYKNFHLVEINDYREKYFEKLIEKEFYLSLLMAKSRRSVTNNIIPSAFNNKNDDFSKEEISRFDWLLLDEFYNNKDLKHRMYFKSQAIPIMTNSIYKRLKGK